MMLRMSYHPPTRVLEVLQKLEYEEALAAGDERYVPTAQARGSQRVFTRLARNFGWDPASNAFFAPTEKHALFFGHIGSGKTTELRRFAVDLNDSRRFYVVEVDVLQRLDRNNLQYPEVLLAMAEALLEQMQRHGYALGEAELEPVRRWFASGLQSETRTRELSAELKAGVEAGGGIPGLVKLLASLTTAAKTGSTWKAEWRQEVRNRFTTLAAAFNGLLRAAEAQTCAARRAERVLFVIDGTDKMRGEDTQRFFVEDAEQLLAIQGLVIYTAPLHLKYGGGLVGKLDGDFVLPMIKLYEADGTRCEAGWQVMANILLQRADRRLFAGQAEIDTLVATSGGHPRELLRLLKLCCETADDDHIDATAVDRAIHQLAADYRYFLTPADYDLLAAVDASPEQGGNDEAAKNLLHRLALMQYNDGLWRRSHPVVRTLEGYRLAQARRSAAPPAAG